MVFIANGNSENGAHEREGKDLSCTDARGSSPTYAVINDWKQNLKLPDLGSKNSSKKRKRIIDDSSSDEDEEHNLNKKSTNKSKNDSAGKGIKMKTKNKKMFNKIHRRGLQQKNLSKRMKNAIINLNLSQKKRKLSCALDPVTSWARR